MPPPPDSDGQPSLRDGFVAGDWTIAPTLNLLARGEEQVRVEPRLMDVLVYLAEHAECVISKEELIDRVWPDRHVTDDVLTVTIYALRKALGDEARQPRYIETVSRRGYRWIAHIRTPERHAPRSYAARWTGIATLVVAIFIAGSLWTETGSRPDRRHHVPTPDAHEAYVKGRYFLDQRSIRGWQQALEQFERAVALDPNDPAAHAGLADAYSAMSDFGVASPAEMRPRATSEAQRALDLDPQSAEAQEALGRAQFLFDWNFAAAEHSLTRAIALDPDYMPAWQATAWVESARGQHAAAIRAAQRALQLDPVNTARYNELAWVLALGGRHDDALRQVDRALQLNPRAFEAYLMKGWTCEQVGQPDAAFAAYTDALRVSGVPQEALQHLEAVYRAEGLPGYYRNWLNRRGGNTPMSETWRAQLYVRVGEPERALESLQRAYEKREGALAWVNVEPSFAMLRSDARFQQIAASVHRLD